MARSTARPLNPSSASQYERVVRRAFGCFTCPLPRPVAPLDEWKQSQRDLLAAAVKRLYRENRKSPDEVLELIPSSWSIRKAVRIPSEGEAEKYQKAARHMLPGKRALALLPLVLGLRAAEVITLTRASVTRAARYGRLLVLRKGGKEAELPAKHAVALFDELLSVRGADGQAWTRAGDILSASKAEQYHALRKLVRRLGELVGLEGMRPHLLRHVFATRMQREGASLAQIQWMLGHANPQTTARYIHVEATDIEDFMPEV